MKEPHPEQSQVGSRDESGPPGTYPRLTGQPDPSNKQPRVVKPSVPPEVGSAAVFLGSLAAFGLGWVLASPAAYKVTAVR
jgi:hypothetical protein